jgi:hypothetical protein
MGIDIESDTPEEKGVVIRAQKHSAVKLAFLVLHKEGVVEAGPTLSMSTRAKDKGCSINAGITLFATVVGSLGLTYDKGNEKFTGTLTVEMKEDLPFLPEKTRIGFELVKKGDKHVFRPIGIPTIFQDVLGSAELIKEIRKLSEGNKCGALDMLFK